MLGGVASLPPSLIPTLQNIGILRHKKAKLRVHMRQSVNAVTYGGFNCLDYEMYQYQ